MKKMTVFFILLAFSAFAQQKEPDPKIRKEIEDYNHSFSENLLQKQGSEALNGYSAAAVLMPEHSRQRTGIKSIEAFYRQWLSGTAITFYEKKIFELQDLGDYILEIGNFTQKLHKKEHEPFIYSGKYMVLWQLSSQKNQKLKIAAEIWGSDTYFDDKELPEIDDTPVPEIKELSSSNPLTEEVKARNSNIKQLVQQRLGAEHAKMFMPDAIYLTYYSPMFIGIKDITAYFTEHEKPGTLRIDNIAIKTSKILKTEKAIVEFGYYTVDWSDGNSKGTVKGKSINVWKRNTNGELMLFRQMVNHD